MYYYRGLLKDKLDAGICELCDEKKKLIVHHLDRDRLNNVPENLQAICRLCHTRLHTLEALIECPCCKYVAHPEIFRKVDGKIKVV